MEPPIQRLAEMTWEEVAALDRERTVAILPVGAIEAHGPHLPLETDLTIAEAMARAGAERLARAGRPAVILPPLAYTAAPFAAAFPGTIPVRPETTTALVVDIAHALAAHGFAALALANAHLDPTHLAALHTAVERLDTIDVDDETALGEQGTGMTTAGQAADVAKFTDTIASTDPSRHARRGLRVIFPDVTRKPWALRLTDEFRSGACHAGQYETSIVLAETPERVREDARATLPPVPHSLLTAIREGQRTFEEAGGPRAYFGDPAAASAEEGRVMIAALGEILAEAVLEGVAEVDVAPVRAAKTALDSVMPRRTEP